MTNRQVLEVRMNQLEFLLLSCKEHPETLYTHVIDTLQYMRNQAKRNEKYLDEPCQLTY